MGRRFTSRQRVGLFLHSRGRCVMCGTRLVQGWHADHVQPHSKGGKTDVRNGQSLCPRDNLKKGAK